MLWDRYVFRRGAAVHELWDRLFDKRPVRLLYIDRLCPKVEATAGHARVN